MRTSMKIASGVLAVVDPITAKYDAILATNPTVPVLFQLPEYRGQQVLFTDAAATDPVTEVGDPIGGVRHPLTGEIIAVQTTDADRPEWGGFEVGAVFNGESQEFETIGTDSNSAPHTVASEVIVKSTESNFIWGYSGGRSAMRTVALGANFNTRYLFFSGGVTLVSFDRDDFGVLFGLYGTDGETEYGLRWRGTEAFTDEGGTPDDQSGLFIGSSGGGNFREMDCRWLTFYQRVLTTEERETLEALS